ILRGAIDHQHHTLQSILAHQASVSYLRPYLSGHLPPIDAATFRRLVPLSTYDDYADHINNLANHGSVDQYPPVLSVDPLHCFHHSSGNSTMKPKLIPCFDSAPATAAMDIAVQAFTALHRKLFPPRPEIVEYSSFLEADTSPNQLKFFIEIEKFKFPQAGKLQELIEALKRCCLSLENGLGVYYKLQRHSCEIAPLLVSVVKPGIFDRIAHVATENGASAGQYKPPKIIRNREIVSLLEESSLLTHHTLQSILAHQASVSYLHPYLSGHLPPIDAATFRRPVPLSSYDDYADHIDTLANNPDHPPVLSVDPLQCFFYSTGTTTMKSKLIPCFGSGQTTAASYTLQASNATLRKLFPAARPEVNKILWFVSAIDGTTTPSGFKITSLSSLVILNKENQVEHLLASPREIIYGKNIEHQIYCHLLCALADPDRIDGIRSNYASGLVRAFGMLESKWEQLCDDLENGSPISDIAMRESVAQLLGGPRVDLSRRMRMICEKQKEWGGIVSKLWPNVQYVNCITTGSMKQYYSKLKYYAGGVMVLGGNYDASVLEKNTQIQH
ncbi:LOW QUALITY PROTEIN: hypothetical protein Tsubulata_039246, partial [Turnera subulata]